MKKLLLALAVMATAAFAGGDVTPTKVTDPVTIQPTYNGPYIGIGYVIGDNTVEASGSYNDYDVTVTYTNATHDGIAGILGYNFNEYFAVEGRYTYLNNEPVTTQNGNELNGKNTALYLKPQYRVTEDAKVYALLGLGQFSLEDTYGRKLVDGECNFQYGIGASYSVLRNMDLFVDYVVVQDDKYPAFDDDYYDYDISTSLITFGAIYNF